jgi:uncharacterized protein YprB with RNaseH-like and TPR domain
MSDSPAVQPLSPAAIREQLATMRELRARIAQVNEKYADRPRESFGAPEPPTPRPPMRYIEEWLTGGEVETKYGRHFETEKLWESHKRHGSADIGALLDLPHDLLETISDGICPKTSPEEWAFLDTETTGLAGGTGTAAFLIGVGSITKEGFRVRQFFMRDYAEEPSQLDALARYLEPFRVLITYNGRTFDQPLLETRFRLNRTRPPFARMEHLDLLFGARRLWKLRFDSCRLVDLENQILGIERQGDIPGALIPYLYFEYLRTHEAARLLPVFHHNALDIVTLACLTGIVPFAFRDPHNAPFRHGAEIAGIARWLRDAGETEQARTLFRRSIDHGLRDEVLFRTMWDLAQVDRKLGAESEALATWIDLSSAKNPFRVKALEELAKHYEHRAKDLAKALEATQSALKLEETPALRHRESRLLKKTWDRLQRLASMTG